MGATLSTVFHQPTLPTGAARRVLFSQISSDMRLLIIANCSSLLLSLITRTNPQATKQDTMLGFGVLYSHGLLPFGGLV